MSLSSGDASDSICPKGWGIVKYDGDGSYGRLTSSFYGRKGTSKSIVVNAGYKEYSRNIRYDEFSLSRPLSLYLSGYYLPTTGQKGSRADYGHIWTNRVFSINNSEYFFFCHTTYSTANRDKNSGQIIRCVAKAFC